MKGKRSKTYRKLMTSYTQTFGFRPPYQVLLTSGTIIAAAQCKMNLGHMLENTLHDEIKPMITQCSIRHLYDYPVEPGAGEAERKVEKEKWIEVAKQAERRRCGHHELEKPLAELECLLSVLDPKSSGTNKHKYIITTQDREARARFREIPGVPLVYINRSVMILEPMAATSENVREREEKGKMRAGLLGGRPTKRKRDDEGEGAAGSGEKTIKKHRAKGPKAPNPLSVKKGKAEKAVAKQEAEDESAAIRKVAKKDPQAERKALGMDAESGQAENLQDGERTKRKRKRKPKEAADADGTDVGATTGEVVENES